MKQARTTISSAWTRRTAATVAILVGVTAAASAATREEQVQRVLTLLAAVGEEYREGVRDGSVVRPIELEEARSFLADARDLFSGATAGHAAGEVAARFDAVQNAIDSRSDAASVATSIAALRQQVMVATGISEQTYPPAAPSAERGRQLFSDYCSGCHGERGDGKGPNAVGLNPPPANFTAPQFIRAETPYDFFHVISLGKRNTAMPEWDDVLSLQDRWDIVSHLWTLSHSEAQLAEGQGVYLSQCANCHGATGNGQGVFAEHLRSKAADLTQPQGLAKRADADLFTIVSDGVAGTPMPAFARTLSDDYRWKAVAFLRTLSLGGPSTPTNRGPSGSDTDPERFRGMLRMLSKSYDQSWASGSLSDLVEYKKATALADSLVARGAALATAVEPTSADVADKIRSSADALRAQIAAQTPAATVSASVADLDALVDTLAPTSPSAATTMAASDSVDQALRHSMQLVETALTAYGRGDANATTLAADAYFEFEPVETRLGAIQPSLKTGIEERFLHLRQTLRLPGKNAELEQITAAIHSDFDAVRLALQPQASAYGLFLQSAGIILREGFEVVLVIGALLAYVSKAGGAAMQRAVYTGTGLGIVASLATALVMGEVRRVYPGSSEILEGSTMLLAAVVLFWVSYWLISKTEADKWQRYIRGKVQRAVTRGSGAALASAAFLAVYREGFETVLFYQALFGSAPQATLTLTIGIVAGSLALLVVMVLVRYFQVQIPMQQFFFVTGMFLYAMAAIFAGQGVHELQEVGIVANTAVSNVPTVPLLGIYPSLQSLGAQAVFVALLVFATFVSLRRRRATASDAAASTDLIDELRALRTTLDELKREPTQTSSSALPVPIGNLSTQVENILQRLQNETEARASNRRHSH
jgi:high-affinity iron transporter